jgi:hypothetical protein
MLSWESEVGDTKSLAVVFKGCGWFSRIGLWSFKDRTVVFQGSDFGFLKDWMLDFQLDTD